MYTVGKNKSGGFYICKNPQLCSVDGDIATHDTIERAEAHVEELRETQRKDRAESAKSVKSLRSKKDRKGEAA